MLVFGNVTHCYWNGLEKLKADNPFKTFYVVKVCNTAKGRVWDYDMGVHAPAVYPHWGNINALNAHNMTEHEFTNRYLTALDATRARVLEEFHIIKKLAGPRTIVKMCHEVGYCHRRDLMGWLFLNRAINAVMNTDTTLCSECYDSYNEWEKEQEDNLIMGWTTDTCDCCGGEACALV